MTTSTSEPREHEADLLALENQVCFALAVASRSVLSLYRPVLEPLGLTHPQYLVMLALWQQSPRSVKNIGAALQLESATLSPLLKRLEAAGYLTRGRSTADERVLDVALTPAGRQLRAQAERIPAGIIETLGMTVSELDALRQTLESVTRAAGQAADRD